jgi:hypothetical protein
MLLARAPQPGPVRLRHAIGGLAETPSPRPPQPKALPKSASTLTRSQPGAPADQAPPPPPTPVTMPMPVTVTTPTPMTDESAPLSPRGARRCATPSPGIRLPTTTARTTTQNLQPVCCRRLPHQHRPVPHPHPHPHSAGPHPTTRMADDAANPYRHRPSSSSAIHTADS